jgi:hypothetical protein
VSRFLDEFLESDVTQNQIRYALTDPGLFDASVSGTLRRETETSLYGIMDTESVLADSILATAETQSRDILSTMRGYQRKLVPRQGNA